MPLGTTLNGIEMKRNPLTEDFSTVKGLAWDLEAIIELIANRVKLVLSPKGRCLFILRELKGGLCLL